MTGFVCMTWEPVTAAERALADTQPMFSRQLSQAMMPLCLRFAAFVRIEKSLTSDYNLMSHVQLSPVTATGHWHQYCTVMCNTSLLPYIYHAYMQNGLL